ncbi:MAG: hypothetical protein C4540_04560 [Candidatus Omnitrophota bacterium]|jgi:hypothetical protein|nr:MAG: hypothetical protein C4540_04560 [Candidatus Omnitrophota bacterium]
MPAFDIKTAIPIAEENGQPTKEPEFDINTALKVTEPIDGGEGYEGFVRSQFHQQIKDNINRPLSAGEVRFIQDAETNDPGALQSFLIPYTEGVVGFFTKPFGYRPDLSRPFGLEKGPKPQAEVEQDIAMQKEHPVAFTLGQIVSGVAPFIATAPLFPQSLLGTLATFETVGLTRKVGEIRTDESLLMPAGEKAKELGVEAIKSGAMAPIWHYSGALRFIGRPYLSAIARAGARGAGTAGLETVFGTDLEQALKQGGMITALSLIFEAPTLAKTALGRGIIAQANRIASEKGLPEGKITLDVDALDAASTRVGLFRMIKDFYTLMRTKIEKPAGPIDPAKQATYDRLTYTPKTPSKQAPGEAGRAIWAPATTTTTQPKAGGMAVKPQKAPVFYSKMTSALAEKMPESAPIEQVRGILQSAQIPNEEIEWSGIEGFLKGKEKISKPELLDYLQKNQMTIEEMVKGVGELEVVEADRATEAFDEGKQVHGISREGEYESIETKDDLERYNQFVVGNPKTQKVDTAKYSDAKYNVVTENYKEMLLKVPYEHSRLRPSDAIRDLMQQGLSKEDAEYAVRYNGAEYLEWQRQNIPYVSAYKEPHWDEPNVFAHARMADVTDEQGRKGLFVNEIQSQWSIDYRKFQASVEKGIAIGQGFKMVPQHPAVTRWHEIILKRLLRYAAENGYDFITWATGEQVAEYYDLSKIIDEIKYKSFGPAQGWSVDIIKDGKILEGKAIQNPEELRNFVGKDNAQKIIDGKKSGSIKGEDLRVGGEWAQNLYDKQIPNWLNDYAKKFGAQVETVEIGDEVKEITPGYFEKARLTTQQSITITPQMKQALLQEGQPVFGKMPKEVGVSGLEPDQMQIFRMDEEMQIVNTKGEIVTLPKGEEYRTLPVYDSEGNIVPNKVKLQDGKQITVYEGELNKLKGKVLGGEENLKILKNTGPKGLGGGGYSVYKEENGVNTSISPNFTTEKQAQKWLDDYREKNIPAAGGLTHPPAPEEEQPKPRIEQRKAEMEFWNTSDIINRLTVSDKEFLKKYIDEKKSLKQIAKEFGEDIEDVKKTEMWAYAHMQEIVDEMRAETEEAGAAEEGFIRNQIKNYLKGKLDPALKEEGEYADLKLLPWLFGEGGQRPDVLAAELGGIIGAPLETEQDVLDLIKAYFSNEIQGRAATSEAKISKAARVKMQKGISAPVTKKKLKPEREITGVGNGSVISTKEDINYEERAKIFRGMPFALLGNKAEVLARLPEKFKAVLRQGIKKVFDLWGGAKGYRVGLFWDIPAENYTLNELSDERYNYYKNIQDPEKQKVMKQTLVAIMNNFVVLMKDAFNLPPAKDNKDFLDMLNSWLKMGLRKERYYFTREVIQEFGDNLLQEAAADKFASPESSAKYYFLENASIFSISKTESGYQWTQGIIRTSKGESAIKNIVSKLIDFNGQLDSELKRDQGMPVMQSDAWDAMDTLTGDIKSGKVNAEETVVVLVDPQYLSPTEAAGTYSVGLSDITWKGHKENLEKHLMPLVKTSVKIIYTNNADYELINWLRAHKLPYNINKAIGAVAERSGRDEIISFINFKFPQQYVSGAGVSAERTLGQVGPEGAGAVEQGQQYVTERVTGQSARFIEWLREHELKLQEEARKQDLIAKIKLIAKSKMLSNITVSRIKSYLGIKEWKNTDIPQIQKVVDYLEGLKAGDKLLSKKQIEVLQGLLEDVKDLAIMPKRIAIEQFGNDPQLLEGLIMSRVANELIPTVDIKEGNPLVRKILNEIDERSEFAEEEVRRRDNQLEEMLTKAEKSRKLPAGEKTKRFFTSQNKEIFRALSGEKVELTKEEVAVVAYLKNFFVMVKEKLGLQKFRKNYITYLEQPLTEKILERGVIGALKQYFDERSAEEGIPTDIMLELDNIIGSEKFFRFALQRKGGIEPTTNIRKIVHEYSSLFETKMALDRVLPLGQVATQLIIKGRSALWLKKFLQNLKGRGLDYEFRSGKMGWLTKVGNAIVDLGYIKLLSLNYYSAIKNIVAGETNSIIWQDFSTYLKGKQRFVSHPKKAYKIAVEHGVLDGTYADYTQRGIGKFKKLQDIAMIGQQAGEVEIRTCLFVSELTDQEWETENISPVKSRKLRDVVAITQGVFSKTESPLWVQTILGRTIMQMNRWRITDAMLLRRIVNGAKEEWSQGNYKGKDSQRLSKAIFFYALGMYLSYEASKAGLKKASQIAQSMAEVINSLISLISQGDLSRMITDNPTLSVMNEFFFTVQAVVKYLRVPGARKPSKIKIQQGIEETYIAPLNTINDIIEELQ